MSHTCHAVNCRVAVPPRLHMCRRHWFMVPFRLRAALLRAYVPGQERRMDPSAVYLRAAAACVRSVAEAEGQPPEHIEAEVNLYESWAQRIDAESISSEP